jgi:hypothetical protein
MADDRRALTYGTAARQQFQRNYPGSLLSFGSASAIKRIMAGVKAPPLTVCANRSIRWPGLHPPVKTTPNEKRILLPNIRRQTCSFGTLAGYCRHTGNCPKGGFAGTSHRLWCITANSETTFIMLRRPTSSAKPDT